MQILQPADAAPCGDDARGASSNPRASSPSSAHSPSSRRLPPVSPPFPAPLRIDAWSLVLSLLPPRGIACAALACSSLAAAAAAVTAARTADATGGSEPRAVPFLVPHHGLPAGAGGTGVAGGSGGTGAGVARAPSAPRYSYFRYSRANVRVTSDESSFPSLLLHFQNRKIVNPPGTPPHEGRTGSLQHEGGAGRSAGALPITPPIIPPYPYPQPPWWWGVLPDYLKRADDLKREERQQLLRHSDEGEGEERKQPRKSFPGEGDAQVVRGGQSDARKRKREGKREGEGEAEAEWQAEQRAVARQALQPHALQDALTSLLPAISAHARSGGGSRAWPGCDCCTRGHTRGEAGDSAEEGEARAGEETGKSGGAGVSGGGRPRDFLCGGDEGAAQSGHARARDEGALRRLKGAASGGRNSSGRRHSCCTRARCPCVAPLLSKAGRGGHAVVEAGREREDRAEGPRREQQEGGEGEADEAEEGEAGEDDVVFECGPFCSCALQQHRMASHPGPRTPTSTVLTAAAAPAAAAAAEEEGASITTACPTCPNRSSQRGVQWSLAVVWSGSKGWTLVAQESIPRGALICQYAGEVVSGGEASARQALYDAAAGAVLRTQIDPSRMGSLGRFMSHECGGGNVARVVVRQAGCLLPAVGLVARREVRQGEELTFSYGGVGEGEGEVEDGDGDGKREVEGSEGGSVGGDDGEGGRVEGEEGGREECWKSGWEQQQQRPLVKRSKCCCGSVRCSGYLPFDVL
ncbi:unnamed protein product [Closterium sp. Naga37s-1]|nr:unnamed protein product [Closterium sp. Naga37s-1]